MTKLLPLHDLYSDYLIVNQGAATAVGLSAMLEGQVSHDAITRCLHQDDYGSAQLWQVVKPLIREIDQKDTNDAFLIFDDTLDERPCLQTNPIVRYHYDHCQGRSVQGINQLNALYHCQSVSLPVAYEVIHKDRPVVDAKTGKIRYVSKYSKHQLLRQMVRQCLTNGLIFKYVLADKWYACADTFACLHQLECQFIMPIKANRLISVGPQPPAVGEHRPISELVIEPYQTLVVWLKGVDFPLTLVKQVLKDGDSTSEVRYLVSNDLRADAHTLSTAYGHRWQVEQLHKSTKSNTGYGQSPAHRLRSQKTHIFLAMLAYVKLESVKLATHQNHFALKKLLALDALKVAYRRWQDMKTMLSPSLKAA